jgi:ATP-dependent DNA helicase RecG
MAPTELLAAQHAETLTDLLAPFGITVGLLTGSVKGKARAGLLAELAGGGCDVAVGTHALLGGGVEFLKLGLVVADEQHRFGVKQRGALPKKGDNPHLLVMSATPIPRTLALIIYGDLDISVIDEPPPGRKRVKTWLVDGDMRGRYLGFVRKNAAEGGQAYIVCPVIDEAEGAGMQSAVEYRRELEEGCLRGLKIGLIHGRMRPREKAGVMEAFAKGELQVLVSTTVIEVGVDVPNASVMIVENAERFGLSALHQLRGRVGRGARESHCVLVSSSRSPSARRRLEALRSVEDGFEIARRDLEARGPGDFFGRRQHGLPELRIADLAADETVVYRASEAAGRLTENDPGLESGRCAALRAEVERMFRDGGGILN